MCSEHLRFLRSLFMLLLLAVLAGCASKAPETPPAPLQVFMPPALREPGVFLVPDHEVLRYVKNLDPAQQGMGCWEDMRFALSQSQRFTAAFPRDKVAVRLGDRAVTYGHMNRTLQRLQELLPALQQQPELLATEFVWLRVGPDFRFTGYYEPTLEASPVRTERFTQPLYMRPPDYAKVARQNGGRYHSRKAINKGVLRNRGLEIAWIEDPVDLVFLQIQGSGRLVFPDGTVSYAQYDGQNRHPLKALGKVMKDRRLLPPNGISLQSIRKYMDTHPEQIDELINADPSYVFFKLGDNGSHGSMGRVLSPRVSVAVDQQVLRNGLTTFMSLFTPDETGKPTAPFQGLMLPQDSGGAIRRHRVDLYFGNGPEAEFTAGYLDQPGAVMVLLERNAFASMENAPQKRGAQEI